MVLNVLFKNYKTVEFQIFIQLLDFPSVFQDQYLTIEIVMGKPSFAQKVF
jgi:hypothetical protein